MADHDHSYKLLFAHARMVRDLLEGFVGGEWLGSLDFNTLERVSENYVSDDLRARADDIVWRVRCGEHYVYLLIEFQSSVEPFMAVRVLTYVGLLYQDLIRAQDVPCGARLPPVLPIVLYNGSTRWRAAQDIESLVHDAPPGLQSYRPSLRYLLIDEGVYEDGELAGQGNLVALLFRLENCVGYECVEELVSTLVDELRGTAQDSLCRAFAVWLDKVILARFSSERVKTVNDLWEKQAMLSERFDVWEAQFRQEGRQEGEAAMLIRVLRKRFGELPDPVRECVRTARPDQLEHWGEQLLEAANLNELFRTESVLESSLTPSVA